MASEFWRDRLVEILGRRDTESAVRDELEQVRAYEAMLQGFLPGVQTAGPDQIELSHPVLGVDGCRAGWVGALLSPAAPRPRVLVAAQLDSLVEMAREALTPAVVGIDIPIGLPDSTTRLADQQARTALPGRSSCVFAAPSRAAIGRETYDEANAAHRSATGHGLSRQAWALAPKIREAESLVHAHPGLRVVEVHPEVAFAQMTGAPIRARKKEDEGVSARLDALASVGLAAPSVLSGSGYGPDDVLDACAAAWTALRVAQGSAHSLPDPPEVFSDGLPAAIWV
ncbi:DUF429 domain-containing protein [Marihabitans asiaticum]|uniref:Putative RNase H-like nuclease n=1 Tax=Marihabitans asiaticum TaxID=415218 RepID=A0A560W9S5_9MICO|nr:DUF429 domain-containing protein [Marihabitans asiaticum]TWD14374.1 putative RNase H-like nuclease [Marihabitans asiaticum]